MPMGLIKARLSKSFNVRLRRVDTQIAVTFFAFSLLLAAPTFAQDSIDIEVPDNVSFCKADILSEGTRMAAEVFTPKNAKGRLPTILMSHGWGGMAEALRPDAIAFAQAGFMVVTFDYRGWGNSDARLIAVGGTVEQGDKLVAEVAEVRGVVDPIDQTTDILNAIHWVQGEPRCDKDRIGIWGSSFSGGHVVYVAARDPRVKAFVSQVGSMDARWAVQNPQLRQLVYQQGTQRTRGEIGYPKPYANFNNMRGQPVWEKLMRYAPIEDIARCEDCAKLFIIAEHEELFDNNDHAVLAHDRATGIKKLVTVKGIKHYGIYGEKRKEAQQLAIEWFQEHLKREDDADAKTEQQGSIESKTKVHRLSNKQRSIFDAFVYVNRIPDAPQAGESAIDLAGRIFGRLANQEGRVLLKLPPGMDQQSYDGLKTFFRYEGEQGVGNCNACHTLPDFADLDSSPGRAFAQKTPSLRNLKKNSDELRRAIQAKVDQTEGFGQDDSNRAAELAKIKLDERDVEQLVAFLGLLEDVPDTEFRNLILNSRVFDPVGPGE